MIWSLQDLHPARSWARSGPGLSGFVVSMIKEFRTDNLIMHSFGEESAGVVDEINACDADVLNIHWIAKLLSIDDIGRLRKPLVWTLHDMWAFCGGEHVVDDDPDARFRVGYLPDNRPPGESGPDLNRIAWEAKGGRGRSRPSLS